MLRFIVRRTLSAIPVLIIGSLLMFLAIRAVRDPLHAAIRNGHVTPESFLKVKHAYGLDKPWYEQYWIFLKNFVRGDFGTSFTSQGAVWPVLRTALANTVVLGVFAAAFYIVLGVVVGVISAVRQYSWFDHVATGVSFVGLSIPPFFFGLLAIVAVGTFYQDRFHTTANLLPITGLYDPGYTGGFNLVMRVRHLILPALTLSVQEIAIYSRYMRTSMLENLNADYLRTARAKGISERRVIFRHAFRNALIPLTTLTAIDIGALAGGLIITEQVFGYPGMGLYFLDALRNSDYPQLLPWSMIVIGFVVLFNLLADLSYAWLDPRIRVD
jgi:peptide/nickel transport system permease protein